MAVATWLTMLLIAVASAPSDPDALARAEGAFHAGVRLRETPDEARVEFRKSAALYRTLRQQGYDSPDLLRNEGNAHVLAGDLPRAILCYRLGLRLAPADRHLRQGLDYAREQVVYPAPGTFGRQPAALRPPWLPRWNPDVWLGLAFLGHVLIFAGVTRGFMTRRSLLTHWTFAALLFELVMLCGLGEELWRTRQEVQPFIVIAKDGVLVRQGNGHTYPARSETPLNRGVEAQLLYARGGWIQIELAGGEVGWVPGNAVLEDWTGV